MARTICRSNLAEWLDEPNRAFGGLNPIEVIERGEIDRLRPMVCELESRAAV